MIERAFKLPRRWSNQVLREIAGVFEGSVINVSGWADRDKEGSTYRSYFARASSYHVSNHTGYKGIGDEEAARVTDHVIDLTAPLAPELRGKFDVVFNHTVLEHIFDVQTAFKNLCELSKDAVIVVVPWVQPMHGAAYGDFWRFTPLAVRRMFEANGFTSVYETFNEDENAGNYVIVVGVRDAARWRGKLPDSKQTTNLSSWIGRSVAFDVRRKGMKRLRKLLGR